MVVASASGNLAAWGVVIHAAHKQVIAVALNSDIYLWTGQQDCCESNPEQGNNSYLGPTAACSRCWRALPFTWFKA